MKIYILGNGDGMSKKRKNTSFLISDNVNVLVEVPKAINWLYESFEKPKVNYTIVTHANHDHYGDLEGLIVQKEFSEKENLLIILPPIENIPILPGYNNYKFVSIKKDVNMYKDSNVSIEFFPVKHITPTYGVKIKIGGKCIGYSSDTEEPVIKELKDCDIIFHDCGGGIHTNEEDVFNEAKKYGIVDKVYAIHVSDSFKPYRLKLAKGVIEI